MVRSSDGGVLGGSKAEYAEQKKDLTKLEIGVLVVVDRRTDDREEENNSP